MKTAVIAMSAALVGAMLGIAGTISLSVHAGGGFDLASAKPVVAADAPSKPLTAAEAVLAAEHFDMRLDRLEKGINILSSEIDDAKRSADRCMQRP